MSPSLLHLPAEILIPIIALLPNRSILKFSQCSHYTRTLANASLHTLNIAFPSPALHVDVIRTTRRASTAVPLVQRRYCTQNCLGNRHAHPCQLIHQRQAAVLFEEETNTNRTIIRIPNTHLYEYGTLVNFHSALLSSILARHRSALQYVDISIWALTVPIAKAISDIHSLRKLSITIQDCFQARGSQRKFVAEQAAAWDVLCTSAASTGRLSSLRIESGDLTHLQLFKLLVKNPRCFELTLLKCGAIGKVLWGFLGEEWEGRSTLRALTLAHCGGTLSVSALKNIEKLTALETLDLHGCPGIDAKSMLDYNRNVWHISQFSPPRSYTLFEEDVLEVDPDYKDDDE